MDPVTIICPSCSRRLRLAPDALGKKIQCPACQDVFTAIAPPSTAPPPPAPPPPPPRYEPPEQPRRHDDYDISYTPRQQPKPRAPDFAPRDDDLSRPPKRRDDDDDWPRRPPRRDEEDDDRSRRPDRWDDEDDRDETPRRRRRGKGSEVVAPAILLIVISTLSMIYNILNVLDLVSFGGLRNRAIGVADPNSAAFKAGAVIVIVVMFLWSFIILMGSILMLNRRSHAAAMTASIVALLPCHFGFCLSLVAGIWSLTVLTNPKVKRAFD